ncbi:ribose-5-phosphate isomerase B [bacterium BMS3Bbin06]|nr:ribose-5-phosphate isomerase B [bacterium BMS3Abin08]GBE34131.1 ribose-5-phosphate isomerase B [bacterium BMS3Bbin06]HDY71779.1 ribose 5-phosphate isomerase B [Nitrospirota bacterium]
MNIVIGADHGGYQLKNTLTGFLRDRGHGVADVGAFSGESSDYPDFARLVADKIILLEAERGILICGSGVGASIAANKFHGIRAAVCHDTYSSRQGVEDDDMNVLCLGARIIGVELAKEVVTAFLKARFKDLDRYKRRLRKVKEIEEQWMKRS